MDDLMQAREKLGRLYVAPQLLVVPSWGDLKKVPSGRRWWQLWKPRWRWERQEPDEVLHLSCGTILCTARQKVALKRAMRTSVESPFDTGVGVMDG